MSTKGLPEGLTTAQTPAVRLVADPLRQRRGEAGRTAALGALIDAGYPAYHAVRIVGDLRGGTGPARPRRPCRGGRGLGALVSALAHASRATTDHVRAVPVDDEGGRGAVG